MLNYADDGEGSRGTEVMAKFVDESVIPLSTNLKNYSWKVIPGGETDGFLTSENNIVWAHLPASDLFSLYFDYFALPSVTNKINVFVVQSNSQREDILKTFDIPAEKVRVIPNTIKPNEFKALNKPTGKIKLIYISQLDRGVDVLLSALEKIGDPNIELTILFPCPCELCLAKYSYLFEVKDPRVTVKNFVPRDEFRTLLSESHILAYPCTWKETFCIALAESMAAGLMAVTSKVGAIPETSLGFARMIDLDTKSLDKAASQYAKHLKKSIKKYRKGFDPTEQVAAITAAFSHERITQEWLNLDAWLGTNR